MRILIATCYPNYGGSTKVLLASAEALKQRHAVTVRGPFETATSRASLSMPLSLSTTWQKLASLPILVRLLLTELRYVAGERPDVVYVHDTPSLYVYGTVARILGLPVVWHVHGDESGALGRRVKERLCDAKICVARFIKDPGSRAPEFVVRNPVEVTGGRARERTDRKRLYIVASICDRKNQVLGVEIARELRRRGRDVTLHLCGRVLEEPYLSAVETAVKTSGLTGHVVFRGHVPPAQIYEDADVLLIPSKYEALPLAFLEALASGVPVVASAIKAHREIAGLIDLPAVFLVEGFSPSAFADAVDAMNPADAFSLAQRVRSLFSLEQFANTLNEVFTSIEKERHASRITP